MTDWSTSPVGGAWFTLAVTALLVLALWMRPRGKLLPRRRRLTLMGLRVATLVVLVFVLWRPSWVTTEIRKLPGTLVVMLDSSRSMQVTDMAGEKSRWQALKENLADAAPQFEKLSEAWDLKFYRFDENVTSVDWQQAAAELPEEPEGPQTAIGSDLDDVLAQSSGERLVAVLLLGDGAQRAFAPRDLSPQMPVERLAIDEIPLYTFAYGKPALGLQSDLRVDDLLVSDVVFAETPVTVQATLTASGFANQSPKVRLLWENAEGEMEVVDTREVPLGNQGRRIPVNLTHTPTVPGDYRVTVEVEPPAGELVTSNNRQSTFVSVRKGGINVLYLAGASRVGGGPTIEPRFVRSALAASPDINLYYELVNYRTERLDIRPALEAGHYDVYLLQNVDVTGLDRASWQQIADDVARGAGLGMLGGFHSFGPGGFLRSPLELALPLRIGRAERQNFGEPTRMDVHLAGPLQMEPVALAGGVHPMLRLGEGETAGDAWAELPPLDGANRFDRNALKANAQVIAEAATPERWPLLVIGAWGNGRTLAFAGDTTWRWQMAGHGEAQHRFWRQLVLWLARKDDNQAEDVWIRLDGRRYQRGSRVEFQVGALDAERNPIDDAEFDVQVELPDGSRVPVRVTRRGEDFVATLDDTSQPGDYRVLLRATSGATELGAAEARFLVPDQDMELELPAAEPTFLASLANMTSAAGGAALAPEELPRLLEELAGRTDQFEEEITQRRTLWDRWPVLLGMIGLLGTEWFLRKRWGLV